MSKLDSLPDRALELAGMVGANLKQALPNADKLLKTGATLGALKVGARTVGAFARRNPVIAVAAVAGAGLLWYAARRKARQAEQGPLEGMAKRVDATKPDTVEQAAAGARPAATDPSGTEQDAGAAARVSH